METALFWALEQRTALGPSVDPGCNWNPLAPIPVGETPDPPAAPVWYDADAAGSWQSGWVRGFTDAGGVRWAEQVDAMMRMIGEAAAAADERGSGTVAEVFEELAAQVRRQFPEVP